MNQLACRLIGGLHAFAEAACRLNTHPPGAAHGTTATYQEVVAPQLAAASLPAMEPARRGKSRADGDATLPIMASHINGIKKYKVSENLLKTPLFSLNKLRIYA
jgi:hypothetical protein